MLDYKPVHSVLFLNCFTDYTLGFGGKYGIQTDRQDKSAVGWQHIERVPKHQSQIGQSYEYTETCVRISCHNSCLFGFCHSLNNFNIAWLYFD